jgi:hypothetical protein
MIPAKRMMVRITPSDNDIAADYALPVRLARSVQVRRKQPMQVNSIGSMERQRLVSNIVRAARAAVTYGLPIVHSTVDVKRWGVVLSDCHSLTS